MSGFFFYEMLDSAHAGTDVETGFVGADGALPA
jgi:hypothetical protein